MKTTTGCPLRDIHQFDMYDPQYVQGMHDWIASHDVVYQTITDYCPHGVWQCAGHNPKASARYRALFGTGS